MLLNIIIQNFESNIYMRQCFFFLHVFTIINNTVDAPSVSVHLANEEPIPSRLIIRPERDNVTLKCRSDANPPSDPNSFGWFKNVIID